MNSAGLRDESSQLISLLGPSQGRKTHISEEDDVVGDQKCDGEQSCAEFRKVIRQLPFLLSCLSQTPSIRENGGSVVRSL